MARITNPRQRGLKYTDPDGEIVITTAILIGAGVSILINYAVQVASNYASGYKGADPRCRTIVSCGR